MADALCPYFGRCGGCSSQHIDYELQLENKKKRLSQVLNTEDITIHSEKAFGYRNRMDFVFHPSGLGLRQKGKWQKVVDVDRCPIAEERVNALLAEVRDFFSEADSFHLRHHTGTYKYAVIRTGHECSSVSLVLNSDSSGFGDAVERVKSFASGTSADTLTVTSCPAKSDQSISEEFFCVKGDEWLRAKYLGKVFEYNVQGFFQNNHLVAEKMQAYCHELLKGSKGMHLLDLYAGVGTFGIVNADSFDSVTMVESFQGCVDAAQRNITANAIGNATAMRLGAEQIGRLKLAEPLVVVTDPPRSGMDPRALFQLKDLEPEKIVYVSCNVRRLALDIKRLSKYDLASAALFDMFPQTNHIEAVVELQLKK